MLKTKVGKLSIAALLLNAMLLVGVVPSAHADERDKCRVRIEKIEARLDEAVAKHGERSPQAEQRRHDLRAEREHCYNVYHSWWDGHAHQWHTERDWDHP